MPYLGNEPAVAYTSTTKDSFSGDGSTTDFTMSKSANVNAVRVVVENVVQNPTVAYTCSGTTISFTSAPPTGTSNIYVVHLGPPAATVAPPTTINNATTFTGGVTLKNETPEDTDGGRESIVTFQGTQSGSEISTLAQIQASHDGTADDQKADLIFKTNDGSDNAAPTEAMRITSQQRLGLGIDDPSDDFEIKPSADEKGITLKTPDSIRPYLNFDANRSGANQQVMRLQGKWNGNTITRFETSTGDDTSNKDNGYFTFQTATSSSDLNTRVRIDEHGIKFGSDTAEANGLNDYETGTFQMSVAGVSGGARGSGIYVKVGNLVHFQWYSGGMTVTSATPVVTGLPFNSIDPHNSAAYASFVASHNTYVSNANTGYININTPTLYFTALNSTAGASINTGSNIYLMVAGTYYAA